MAKEKLILDIRSQRKDGTYPIKLYVVNKRDMLISTGFYSLKENFSDGLYTKNEPNYRQKNAALRSILSKAETESILLVSSRTIQNMDDKRYKEHLKKAIFGKESNDRPKVFIDYLDEFISLKDREGTITLYNTTRNKISEFDEKATFKSMDKNWLLAFERWMINSGLKVNSYAIHLRNIRAIFNYAIDQEYTTLYPFRKFKIKKEETRKRALTVEEVRLLRDFPCEKYQERYRDMFLLMIYLIGVNAVDLFMAPNNAIIGDRFEFGRFEYKRAKTGKFYSIKLEPEAHEIIKRYKGKNYMLNIMDEIEDYKNFLHSMDIVLKEIGPMERKGRGGKKERQPLFPDLSSYWSRHTWATIAASLDIPKEVIAEALGHTSNSVTDIYIKFDHKKVDQANRAVIDLIFKKD